MTLQSGYVVFSCGDGSPDWRVSGAALPRGAVVHFVCDGEQTLTLHGHGERGASDFASAIADAIAAAEQELAP